MSNRWFGFFNTLGLKNPSALGFAMIVRVPSQLRSSVFPPVQALSGQADKGLPAAVAVLALRRTQGAA
jgi:hypothetical protein